MELVTLGERNPEDWWCEQHIKEFNQETREWAEEQGYLPPTLLNLGCGEDYNDGWHNVDISAVVDPDETVDLNDFPWPFPSDHFTRIQASHVVEHLERPIQALQEVGRILIDGGTLELTYPIGHTRFEDPTHEQYWNWNTAAALAGGRKHGHEHVADLELTRQELDWHVGDRLWRAYTRVRLWYDGPGPWLGQIPGLSGEVTAIYKYRP
ncbi:class I SAM-dependent methyltransferase [Natrinema sp. CGMCC1.2065]|uniref:class I SAM-dependent methyltransferase n=1 Tax=Natrinema sp. CGMCC1.2065 TaxID=3445767 RepID=UPI003F49F3F6